MNGKDELLDTIERISKKMVLDSIKNFNIPVPKPIKIISVNGNDIEFILLNEIGTKTINRKKPSYLDLKANDKAYLYCLGNDLNNSYIAFKL